MTENMKNEPGIVRSTLTLFIITALAAFSLALAYSSTREKIAGTEKKKKTDSFELIFPDSIFGEEITDDELTFLEVFDKDKKLKGFIIFTEGKGYSSTIKIAYGINLKAKLTGIKILSQQETPGLGARCEEVKTDVTLVSVIKNLLDKKNVSSSVPIMPWFQEQYKGLALHKLWLKNGKDHDKIDTITSATARAKKVKPAIEAITGATITSHAITKAIRESLEKFLKSHKKSKRKRHGMKQTTQIFAEVYPVYLDS